MVGTADLQIKALLALYHTSSLCPSFFLVSFFATYIGWLAGHGWVGWDLDWSGYEGFGMEI